MKLTHASVFSGIGGPEVAAAMLGWDNLFHCEINPFGRAVLEYWFPNAKSYEDITKTDFSEWEGKVNVLTGGFPCQPFSYAGQRRGADDDRYLWPYMHRCINQVRPDWVVCENVAGILTMVEQGSVTEMAAEKSLFDEVDTLHRYRLDETFTLERISEDLESDGYAVQAVIIPACAVNAPHRRDRVFIIGHRIVADTDNGADGRTARKNEGESSAQRLQERHEVRQPDKPTQVRPTAEGYVPDSISTGLERQDQPRCGEAGERVHLRRDPARRNRQDDARMSATDPSLMHLNGCQPGDGCDGSRQPQPELGSGDCTATERGTTTHADCNRRSEMDEHLQPRLADGPKPVGDGRERIVADTSSERPQTGHRGRETGEANRDASGWYARSDCDIAGCGRWDEFPTQSPVHRGNDGIPFPLDDLTISPSKWRTESLKAYGNAIVPQVMYEIFKAIEETYK